jgi:hypothetical protein
MAGINMMVMIAISSSSSIHGFMDLATHILVTIIISSSSSSSTGLKVNRHWAGPLSCFNRPNRNTQLLQLLHMCHSMACFSLHDLQQLAAHCTMVQ